MNKKLYSVGFLLFLVVGVFSVVVYVAPYKASNLSQEDAINTVIDLYPELASYRTTSLPPSSIEAKQATEGWYVGFLQSGSGVRGVLHAECYQVTDEKKVVLIGTYSGQSDKVAERIMLETCEPIFAQQSPPAFLAYGDVTLMLNQLATFKNISIRPLSIEEDSRCPNDVQCIQAGTVRVKVEVVSGMGTSTNILKLGQIFTTEAEAIILTSVMPEKSSKVTVAHRDYRFVFNVAPRESSVKPAPQGRCYVGGCSGQLCTDRSDVASTCEYRSEYACYKSATCRRQPSGECGWTETPELSLCLINARSEAL